MDKYLTFLKKYCEKDYVEVETAATMVLESLSSSVMGIKDLMHKAIADDNTVELNKLISLKAEADAEIRKISDMFGVTQPVSEKKFITMEEVEKQINSNESTMMILKSDEITRYPRVNVRVADDKLNTRRILR